MIAKPERGQEDHLFASPELLPGGKNIRVSVVNPKNLTDLRVLTVEVATGTKKTFLEAAGETRFAPTGAAPGIGHLLYGRNGSLFAAAFNATTLQVGPAAPVLEGLREWGGARRSGRITKLDSKRRFNARRLPLQASLRENPPGEALRRWDGICGSCSKSA